MSEGKMWICPKCCEYRKVAANITQPKCAVFTCADIPMQEAVVVSAAALAEARRPKTCAGCQFITDFRHDGMLTCNNRLSKTTTIPYPEEQSCIHWEPAPATWQEK